MEVRQQREGWSDQRWQGYVDKLTAELEADEPVSLHQSAEYAVQISTRAGDRHADAGERECDERRDHR